RCVSQSGCRRASSESAGAIKPNSNQAGNENNTIDTLEAKIMAQKNNDPNVPKPDKEGFIGVRLDKKKLYDEIPLTDEKKKIADDKLLISIYNLGKIYHFKLEELEDAKVYYEKLLNRFPDSKQVPEVLYLLRLICIELKNKNCETEYYDLLTQKHPDSDYAKMLLNPDWKKIAKKQKQLEESEYKICLEMYQNRQFKDADSMLVMFKSKYPDSELNDRVDMLRTLIVGHSRLIDDYKKSLQEFMDKHPKSALLAHAKFLYESCENMEKSEEYKKARIVDEDDSDDISELPPTDLKNNPNPANNEPDNRKEKSITPPQSPNPVLEDVDGQK
ncbi:MAG: tetratricopeptide repeat protein, partial [Cytophagales bacterium]